MREATVDRDRLKKVVIVLVVLFFTLSGRTLWASTRYVAPTGTNAGNCTSQSPPCLTLQYAFSQMSRGDTVRIANGTYSGSANDLNTSIPNGTGTAGSPDEYTILEAENDGGAIITSNFKIGSDSTRSSYIIFRGLKINSTMGKSIIGHHIKIFRTAFQGGPNGNNTVNLGIGTIGSVVGAHHILLEDVWSYGYGGRYNILIYNAEDVVVRRVVIRHDGGWTVNVSSNPESGITIYDSQRVQLQNVIVLDSIADSPNWTAAFYNVHNNSNNNTPHDSTRTVGSMAINNPVNGGGSGFAWDDSLAMTNVVLENSIVYNSGTSITSNGADKFVTISGVTLYGGTGNGISKYGNGGAFMVSNVIIYGKSGSAFNSSASGSATANVLCFNNSGSTGCTITNINPETNGLLYLPRRESGSYLANANIGATIMYRTGESGTMYGETGFNMETTEALWPWPYQDRIFTDLCGVRSSALCSAANLTTYIWSLLGNGVPSEFSAMPTPVNVKITKN